MPVQVIAPRVPGRLDAFWADTGGWIAAHAERIIAALVIAGVVAALLLGAKWLGARLAKKHVEHHHWRRIVGVALAKTRLWFIVAVALQLIATFAHAPPDLAKIVYFLFVIAATLQAAVYAREVVLGLVAHRAEGHEGLGSALNIIRLLVTITLFALATILILSNLGVNVTGLGIGGIAIGLAAQGIFKDLFAALSILFDRPFRVGDLIKFGDVTGRVEAIGLKTTRLRAVEGEQVVMSNDRLLDEKIRNFHGIGERRIVLSLPLHYANDAARLAALPDQLKGIMGAIADCRFNHAYLTSFDSNAVMLELMLHSTKGAADVRDRVRHEAMTATLAHLQSCGVLFSYQASITPEAEA